MAGKKKGNEISHNSRGIFLWMATDNIITNNIINNNSNSGIFFYGACHRNIITDNILNNNAYAGLRQISCSRNRILRNIANNNEVGIEIANLCDHTLILNNSVSNCKTYGIILEINSCVNHTFSGNKFYGCGLLAADPFEPDSFHTIDTTNLINDKPLYYYYNVSNLGRENFTNAGQIILDRCNDSLISNCEIFNASRAIHLKHCNNVEILNNSISHNIIFGIYITRSSNNLIYLNYFSNNGVDARVYESTNQWDNSTIGNYWSNYNGKDIDDDGIGDTPYNIPEVGIDNFPICWDPPKVALIYPSQNQLVGHKAPDFSLSADEGIPHTIWYSLPNGYKNYTSELIGEINQKAWESIGNGTHTIYFYVNDSQGLMDIESVTVRKDIVAPVIIITSPNPDQIFNNTIAYYSLEIIEPHLDKVWYTLDGTLNITITEFTGYIDQQIWDTYPTGSIDITFYALDKVGNIGQNIVSITKIRDDPNNSNRPGIPGYNLFLIIGLLCTIFPILIKIREDL